MPTDKTQYTKQDYEKILFNSPEIKFFFTVSLPAAIKRNEVPGHILFVCHDELTRNHFVELLRLSYKYESVKLFSLPRVERVSDIGAILTSLPQNSLIVHEDDIFFGDQGIADILGKALDTFSFDITIGKGNGSRSLKLDIPPFTFVCCTERGSETLDSLINCFEYIITVNKDESRKICDTIVQYELENAGFLTDEDTCGLISSKAKNQSDTAMKYARRIAEYVRATHPDEYTIRAEHAKEVLNTYGMAYSKEDIGTDDIYYMLRNINDSLHMIKRELSSINSRLDILEEIQKDISSVESKMEDY